MTKAEIAKILGNAYLTFPHLALTREAILAWHELFEDVDRDDFAEAMKTALKTPGRRFFPTAGEVSEVLQDISDSRHAAALRQKPEVKYQKPEPMTPEQKELNRNLILERFPNIKFEDMN